MEIIVSLARLLLQESLWLIAKVARTLPDSTGGQCSAFTVLEFSWPWAQRLLMVATVLQIISGMPIPADANVILHLALSEALYLIVPIAKTSQILIMYLWPTPAPVCLASNGTRRQQLVTVTLAQAQFLQLGESVSTVHRW